MGKVFTIQLLIPFLLAPFTQAANPLKTLVSASEAQVTIASGYSIFSMPLSSIVAKIDAGEYDQYLIKK